MYPMTGSQGFPVVYYQPNNETLIPSTGSNQILDPAGLNGVEGNSVVEKTTTTTTRFYKPDSSVPEPTSTAHITATIKPTNRDSETPRSSVSASSTSSSSSSKSMVTPENTNVLQAPVITTMQTSAVAPVRRVLHRAPRLRTPSGYISSDLDYGKQRVYKTDYKYRHYYCCNICRGRYDLHNRSYSCFEWFYGCPLWAYLLLALLLLALVVTFFTLFGLQPTLNASRRSETVETRLINRTQIIYGFYQNCGFQVNATFVPTTLILCTNTATTTTARIELSSFYTVISCANSTHVSMYILGFFVLFSVFDMFNFSKRF